MGQRGSKCQSVKHLCYTSLLNITLLISTPITCGKSTSKSSGDSVSLDRILDVKLFLSLSEFFFDRFLHIIDHDSELLSEKIAQQGTRHIHSLLSIVISIILSCTAQ